MEKIENSNISKFWSEFGMEKTGKKFRTFTPKFCDSPDMLDIVGYVGWDVFKSSSCSSPKNGEDEHDELHLGGANLQLWSNSPGAGQLVYRESRCSDERCARAWGCMGQLARWNMRMCLEVAHVHNLSQGFAMICIYHHIPTSCTSTVWIGLSWISHCFHGHWQSLGILVWCFWAHFDSDSSLRIYPFCRTDGFYSKRPIADGLVKRLRCLEVIDLITQFFQGTSN